MSNAIDRFLQLIITLFNTYIPNKGSEFIPFFMKNLTTLILFATGTDIVNTHKTIRYYFHIYVLSRCMNLEKNRNELPKLHLITEKKYNVWHQLERNK